MRVFLINSDISLLSLFSLSYVDVTLSHSRDVHESTSLFAPSVCPSAIALSGSSRENLDFCGQRTDVTRLYRIQTTTWHFSSRQFLE